MKHTTLLALLVVLFSGCCQEKTEEVSVMNPIMPIHYTGEVMHVFLTDYVPALSENDSYDITFDQEGYSIVAQDGIELDIVGNNTQAIMHLQSGDIEADIVILPEKPVNQDLVCLSSSEKSVTIACLSGEMPQTIHALIQNQLLPSQSLIRHDDGSISILLPEGQGRTFLRVYAENSENRYNDLLIPMHNGQPITDTKLLNRHDDQSQVLYSLMIDRFHNGNMANDWKLNSEEVLDIADYQGGDLAGVKAKIDEGFFDDLGVTTLWISPITQNPWDAWGRYPFAHGNKYDSTKTYTRYSGYHGYWPIYSTVVDRRFGTDQELRDLLADAHSHQINVVLDYVANHLHIASPVLQQHPDWHTDSILPDGRRNFELYDEARLTTWFDVHIPTLDLERQEVYEPMTDSALYWLQNFEFDGFRHDACKHIPECYWRTLTHKAVTRFPNRHIWMIGETYGSPELINTYVKTGMLNAQFDFNVYFTATSALVGKSSMQDLNRVILESLATYGAHHTMGNVSGNHDQARFASVAGGAFLPGEDAKEVGWTREVGIGDATKAYRLAMLLEMVNLTIPGVPCIYQGDEIAEVGGNDPDNRHPMRFTGLSEQETQFRNQVKTLIHLRRGSMAIMYGEFIPVMADDDTIEYERRYMNEVVRIRISRNSESTISIDNKIVFTI